MANTYTTGLKLTKPALGDAGWGTTVNGGFTDLVDQAVVGSVNVAVTSGGTTTLATIADGVSSDARNMSLIITGSLTSVQTATVRVPATVAGITKLYSVANGAGGTVTVETSGGTSVAVPDGARMLLRVTSAGVSEAVNYVPNVSPTGEIKMWPTGTPPTGYLLCNGAEVSRSTYAALFAVIGTTFGSAGPTTFTLPNYNNRMPIGAGGLYALGATGGSKDATLVSHSHTFSATTGNQSADHTHSGTTASSGTHTHGTGTGGNFLTGSASSGTTGWDGGGNYTPVSPTSTTASDGAHTHTFTTGGVSADHTHSVSGSTNTQGSSATDANLPPYLAINFIIKT